jgi:hypothetical protein
VPDLGHAPEHPPGADEEPGAVSPPRHAELPDVGVRPAAVVGVDPQEAFGAETPGALGELEPRLGPDGQRR